VVQAGPGEEEDAVTQRLPVVVGVDPSDSARHAALWAADLAANQARPLHLLYAEPDGPASGTGQEPDWLRELLDAALRSGADAEARIVPGGPVGRLVELSAESHLLVVGSYGTGAQAGMLAGEVALALVDRARCPVAVVRGTGPGVPPRRTGPVVVGVDGSPAGDAALELAAEIAMSSGAWLLAVHAWSDVQMEAAGAARRAEADVDVLADRAAQELDARVTAVRQRHSDLPVEQENVTDTALRALLARADVARAVVVAQRASLPPQRGVLVLGSTSRGLVEFAPCPVVVARAPGHL
jgi:nucleotide-binding universal stress UspA family protein